MRYWLHDQVNILGQRFSFSEPLHSVSSNLCTCLCCSPPVDETSGETTAKPVNNPQVITFRLHQGGVDVETVTHGVMAPCINKKGSHQKKGRHQKFLNINSTLCTDFKKKKTKQTTAMFMASI